mgnify:CR=1 FL=1
MVQRLALQPRRFATLAARLKRRVGRLANPIRLKLVHSHNQQLLP